MTKTQIRLLAALKASLQGIKCDWSEDVSSHDWHELFQLAQQHHILPLIFEAVHPSPAFASAGEMARQCKQKTLQQFFLQTKRTSEFLALYQAMTGAGLRPLVVKGLVCRTLYPQPELRLSSDEDVLIPSCDFLTCHDLFLRQGLALVNGEERILEAYEVPYRKETGVLLVELHKRLFPPNSQAYGDFNHYFDGAEARAVEMDIQGVTVYTLSPTDHFFYLVCHAFKHFLHSGFGIRQVCDICLFAKTFHEEIDWPLVHRQCAAICGESFTGAILNIGARWLGIHFDHPFPDMDELPLLKDLLSGGVYGSASEERLHSSTITLNAAVGQKQGKTTSLLRTLFPSCRDMEARYPELKDRPYLLPVKWADRIVKYRISNHKQGKKAAAAQSLRIGQQRLELLRQYGIIE